MISYNDIELLNTLLNISNRQGKSLVKLLNRYNIEPESVRILFNTRIYLNTFQNFDIVDVYSVITKGSLECAHSILDVLEYALNMASCTDSKQVFENRGISYETVKELLNINIHKDIKDVTYKGDSLYLRIASEINTEFKNAKVDGLLEKKVSKLFELILRQVVSITDNRMSCVLNMRILRNKSYKVMHGDTIRYTKEELGPTLSEGLEECGNEIREAVRLLISKGLKQRKIYELKNADTTCIKSYEVDALNHRIRELYGAVSLIDKKIDIMVKYCAYIISKKVEVKE